MASVAIARVLRPAIRRLASCGVALTVPLGGFLGLTMLFVGRSESGALVERLLLAVRSVG